MVDRDSALTQIQLLNGFGIGNSKANALFWTVSRAAPMAGFNTTPKMADISVKAACASNSACDALGMIGDCCPVSSSGVYLGCCPKE